MFAALLDTNVLLPSTCRDFLLSLAVEGIYRPIWSTEILAELQEHEEAKLMRVVSLPRSEASARSARLIASMTEAFPEASAMGWEPLVGIFGLPDPDDEHVLAAARIGGAGAIVTWNDKDFPAGLLPKDLEAIRPPRFALQQVEQNPPAALLAVREMSLRSNRELRTVDDILEILARRYEMHEAVDALRAVAGQT